jgi:hypothetical protein
VEGQLAARRRRKAQYEESYLAPFDQNERFAYIAGYTAAGFAYSVSWEEWEGLDLIDLDGNTNNAGTGEPQESVNF